MAVTVRFPNGQAIRYNRVNDWDLIANGSVHLKSPDGIVARLSPSFSGVIEWNSPCDVSNPLTSKKDAAKLVLESIREIPDVYLKDLKHALDGFDGRRCCWKDER